MRVFLKKPVSEQDVGSTIIMPEVYLKSADLRVWRVDRQLRCDRI
ncbi:hypothetical protein [Microcoleus sp. LEGE 07076]|nr:hypothetical protein [Microcoleus sp. LEGE 07076]